MKKPIRISEEHKDVTCKNCGWSWDIEPDDKHPYLCHQCGHENTKGETDEGAGPYDAPSFQMKPDHVHFKHQYNEQNDNKGYLLQMGRKSIIVEQYGDEAELFKLASAYYRKNGKVMTIKVLEKILHTLSKRDEPHRAKSQEFPPSLNLQEQKGPNDKVRRIQKQLISLGYNLGKTGADGFWGGLTDKAWKDYKSGKKPTPVTKNQGLKNNLKTNTSNTDVLVSDTLVKKHILFNPNRETTPFQCTESGCAEWVSNQLDDLGLERQGNAWHSHNIGENTMEFTPFKNLSPNTQNQMANLFSKINANPTEKSQEDVAKALLTSLIPSQQSLKKTLNVNDVVGLFYNDSTNFTKAFFEGATGYSDMGKGDKRTKGPYFITKTGQPWSSSDLGKKIQFVPGNSLKNGSGFGINTHLGYVGAVVKGEPIIFHNVHGDVYSTPLSKMGQTKVLWVKTGPGGLAVNPKLMSPSWWDSFVDLFY
jgi:hypothetical protein